MMRHSGMDCRNLEAKDGDGLKFGVAIATAYFEVGSRPDSRDTFATETILGFHPSGPPIGCSNSLQANLCLSKEKYPKKRHPDAAFILRAEAFQRG
ncbi:MULTISPECIES: hypothetical protein [Methylomonas]|uniref:Uncharacterized protein n=1 Tax=Methylomonas denitrificans TaxID=1538553 RepID=A0A126T8E7_9GAMM|nr:MULTISPECIES: hypothetical protein [Methylomonas]AMK78363.1 hypothetical protein JT25_018025 [Methylomonas denitrificans]OAI04073.1 hypothetical protein A1342_05950 [Methylomonas methanica]